ncbi:hypothetical protein BH10PAT1_BH10PAT1_4190 [soil metagenome]
MDSIRDYRIQITGPSGSGKSYFAEKLKLFGYNAIDADRIDRLGKFVNKNGEEVEYDDGGDLEWLINNIWVWDISILKNYLSNQKRIIIFEDATNEIEASKEFDYIFYLNLPKDEILNNLKSEGRANPYGKTEVQQTYANKKIDEFYTNIPKAWIALNSRDPEKLINEIENNIKAKLRK